MDIIDNEWRETLRVMKMFRKMGKDIDKKFPNMNNESERREYITITYMNDIDNILLFMANIRYINAIRILKYGLVKCKLPLIESKFYKTTIKKHQQVIMNMSTYSILQIENQEEDFLKLKTNVDAMVFKLKWS